MVSKSDYTPVGVAAARSVLVELMRILGEYGEHIVVIGGSALPLLIPEASHEYEGTLDVDLALDHQELEEEGYARIDELLRNHGYYQKDGEPPFKYFRDVETEGQTVTVEVDLLAGEYGGTGKSHRHQVVQGIKARKARACDLALDLAVETSISGVLPGGGEDTVSVRVAMIVPLIVMKGMALNTRLKEKDSYDIYFSLRNYPGGMDAVIEEFCPHMGNVLVREGLEHIAAKFSSPHAIGPKHVTDFLEVDDPEQKDILRRDAFELARQLLTALGIIAGE